MPKKVLVVDDSLLILKIVEVFLRGDYSVVTATSGPEAVATASTERPDLILMDFNMPGGNGPEAAAALARDTRTKHIPVVLMTTASHLQRLGEGIDRLEKPFDRPGLVHKIREYLH
jgi:two-component system, cell cycle response regulator